MTPLTPEQMIEKYSFKLTKERREKLDRVIAQRTRHFTMVLEDFKDPHNMSAVVRTSEVFGFQDVHIIEELNSYNISKPILKGSFKWLSLFRYKKRQLCMDRLKASGYRIAVASTHATRTLDTLDLSEKTAFYLGAETLGNHPDTLAQADHQFFIPQFGLTESMNVSVCAGVIIAHLTGWLSAKGRKNYVLSESEQLELRADFYERSALGSDTNSPMSMIG